MRPGAGVEVGVTGHGAGSQIVRGCRVCEGVLQEVLVVCCWVVLPRACGQGRGSWARRSG